MVKWKSNRKNSDEQGFSLIDAVVTVAIIVALSVGGFVSYNGLVSSAKQATVESGADQVRTSVVLVVSGALNRTVEQIRDEYNGSADGLAVEIIPVTDPGDSFKSYRIEVGTDKDGDGYIDNDATHVAIRASKP